MSSSAKNVINIFAKAFVCLCMYVVAENTDETKELRQRRSVHFSESVLSVEGVNLETDSTTYDYCCFNMPNKKFSNTASQTCKEYCFIGGSGICGVSLIALAPTLLYAASNASSCDLVCLYCASSPFACHACPLGVSLLLMSSVSCLNECCGFDIEINPALARLKSDLKQEHPEWTRDQIEWHIKHNYACRRVK